MHSCFCQRPQDRMWEWAHYQFDWRIHIIDTPCQSITTTSEQSPKWNINTHSYLELSLIVLVLHPIIQCFLSFCNWHLCCTVLTAMTQLRTEMMPLGKGGTNEVQRTWQVAREGYTHASHTLSKGWNDAPNECRIVSRLQCQSYSIWQPLILQTVTK